MAIDRTRSVRLKRRTVRYLIGSLALILLLVFAFSRNRGGIAESIHVPSSGAVTYAERVKNAMRHNFRGYAKHCFGDDEYEPVSGKCHHWFGMGLTILDSIDTLLIMGLREEYALARKWVETLDVKSNTKSVSMFESVIRVLGGLNSAYAMTGDDIWKKKAIEFGDAVIHAFDTPSGCPNPEVTLHGRDAGGNSLASTAEVGTLQLEFRTLSVMSGNPKYAEAVDKCELALLNALPSNSLPTANFLTGTGKFAGDVLTIGANTDSFIEMMLKTWIAFGKKEDKLRVAFEKSVEHVFSQLGIQENGTLVLGISQATGPNIPPAEPQKVMEHLACFFPGALALAAMHGLGGGVHGTKEQDYMTRARKLTRTCFLMTRTTPEGLAPEISEFVNGTLRVKEDARHSLLRPEIVESHYLLNEITGGVEEQYREWGKIMWDDIERSARTKRTYLLSSVFRLGTRDSHHGDKLHSFVLAETLKYFYLLFRGSGEEPRMALDEWVFNTEAHPVRIQSSPKVLGTSKYKFR